jgi:hypothetical protein
LLPGIQAPARGSQEFSVKWMAVRFRHHYLMKAFLLLAAAAGNALAAPLVLHVATNGNDNASGAITRRAGDGPLATIEAALRKARAAGAQEGATILVHGGVHRLKEPMVLTPEDSGVSAEKPLTIRERFITS